MKILVTGGAGYIGSHIVLELCNEGYDVIVLDDLSLGNESSIDSRSEFIKGSTLDKKILKKVIPEVDSIIHLAAFKSAGESMVNPNIYTQNNIQGTLRLIDTMNSKNKKNIIFSSTAAVYGNPQYLPLDENHPTNPINYYGFTKLTIENILSWYKNLKNFNVIALRYFNAAGYDKEKRIVNLENKPQNLIPIVMECAAGIRKNMQIFGDDYNTPDGTCLRDYIHVTDIAKAHIIALKRIYDNKFLSINLGTGNTHSVYDVINTVQTITSKKINFAVTSRREGDPANLYSSSSFAKESLGWVAKNSDLENIIKTTWSIYKTLI
tara:strand:- start:44 stop:1009 length:966 start_codon:yes stop_codon:yes gene_type:complete